MARKCEKLKKDGSPCGANALVGKDYCQAHGPKDDIPSPVAAAIPSFGDTLERMSEEFENLKDRVGRNEKQGSQHDERLDVMEGRQDVFQKMLEEDIKIEGAWKPIPKERYPAAIANDPNNKWVMVTPIENGEVTVLGKGINFTVEFKRGHTMGTYTTFINQARNRGLIL